jgi:hypothetical protein
MQPAGRLPADWPAVLEQIQQVVAQAVAATEREPETAAAPAPDGAAAQALARFEEHLGELRACGERARRNTAEADALFGEAEEAVQRWLAASAGARRQPAPGAGRGI